MKKFQAALVMAGSLLVLGGSAHAATFTYSGTLSDAVAYNRPSFSNPDSLAINCTDCGYQSEAISVDTSGNYTFKIVTTSFHDEVGILYSSQFDPVNPLTNLDGTLSIPFYSVSYPAVFALTPGIQYYWVASTNVGYFTDNCQSTACTFTTSVTGPGAIDSSVPEPSTWAMLLVGLGLTGFLARRRQRAVHARGAVQ